MRVPAEAALRKAVQLQPGYAGAHYNLAVVYATQKPPAPELARWHYQKAVDAGHPRNPDLEKKFETSQ
jgi:Tfp pilus assembly protein PilF